MVEDDILFTNHPRASMCNSYTFSIFNYVPFLFNMNSCSDPIDRENNEIGKSNDTNANIYAY